MQSGTIQDRRNTESTNNDLGLEKDQDASEAKPLIDPYDPSRPKLSLRNRLHHFTWAWYTLSMSTGGLSMLMQAQAYPFPHVRTIGLVIYLINVVMFFTITLVMLLRFVFNHGDLLQSITHPREGFFLSTFFLAVAVLITSTERYAIPVNNMGLTRVVEVFFWIYVVSTLILAVGHYSFIFSKHRFSLHTMMPTWILPIFPIMLSGTIASVIAETQPEVSALPILVIGLTCQGLGLSVAFFMYAHMIGRLMQAGLPNREHRPGLFMCVGPPAFTALALIGMSKAMPPNFQHVQGLPEGFEARMIENVALTAAIFLWALSLWWLGIGIAAVFQSPPKYFHLGWWATVFPNTGFTLASISIAKEFDSAAVRWVTVAMSIIMVVVYLFVLVNHIRAVIRQDIMYPGRDEDVEDH